MFRKVFLTFALVAFCLSTIIGCAKPASKAQPTKKPAATTEKTPAEKAPADKAPAEKAPAAKADAKKAEPAKKADAKPALPPAAQAPPSVSE